MTLKLIPETVLLTRDAEIKQRLSSLDQQYTVNAENEVYGPAFRIYLLFTHWPCLAGDVAELTKDEVFYNRYYWFLRFVRLHALQHGYDVGMEQQASQMLETVDGDLDWFVIQQIEDQVRKEN